MTALDSGEALAGTEPFGVGVASTVGAPAIGVAEVSADEPIVPAVAAIVWKSKAAPALPASGLGTVEGGFGGGGGVRHAVDVQARQTALKDSFRYNSVVCDSGTTTRDSISGHREPPAIVRTVSVNTLDRPKGQKFALNLRNGRLVAALADFELLEAAPQCVGAIWQEGPLVHVESH
jgi:hypothetical protein